MTGLGVAAIVLTAFWLMALTLLCLVLVRQLSVLTIKTSPQFSRLATGTSSDEAFPLETGRPLPEPLFEDAPQLREGHWYIANLSPTCAPCRQFASQLSKVELPANVLALVAGPAQAVNAMVDSLIPDYVPVLRGEAADRAVALLSLEVTPFLLQIDDGVVSGWSHVSGIEDLFNLANAWRDQQNAVAT